MRDAMVLTVLSLALGASAGAAQDGGPSMVEHLGRDDPGRHLQSPL